MDISCMRCKGRGHCGRSLCPHIVKAQSMFKARDSFEKNVKEEFMGSSPAPFVGRFGYPHVNVGILSPPERKDDAWLYDAPRHWSENKFSIPQIVDYRSALINSRFKADIRSRDKMLDISREVGMSSQPVDIEFSLSQKPHFSMRADSVMAPQGPNAQLKDARLTSNPKIHTKVDKVFSDTDLKAVDALKYLSKGGFDENFLSKLLSVGTIGIKKDRRLVPTRWSITATDDILGKDILAKVRDLPQIGSPLGFFGSYLGNYYIILMLPEVWSYELFETYMPKASWNTSEKIDFMTDYEPYSGRKYYADNCAGGYYTVRLAILEKLAQMKKQASVLAVRVITGDYSIPLGVWVTRQAARQAVQEKPLEFSEKDLALRYAKAIAHKRFGFDLDLILKKSILLREQRMQKKLTGFL